MKSKIKIAYIIDSINSVAGTEKQLLQTIQHLNKERFEVKLICLRKPSSIFHTDRRNFEYIELDIKRLFSMKALFGILWLIYYLRKRRIDIIQTLFFDATLVGVTAGRIAGVKNIISCRRDLGFWHTSKLLRVLRIINKMTTRVLTNSYAVKVHTSKCENLPESKIDVIKNGIHLNQFGGIVSKESFRKSFAIPDDDYIIGIVANLNRHVKRIDVFINMALEVLKVIPNVSFQIVGDGHLRHKLEQLAARLDISNKIFFMGRKKEIYSIIENWDIGVLSSDSEGFSNAILEYMEVGLPVVATNTGGNSEVIEEGVNGVLVSPGDYKLMAEKICRLLQDNKKRLEMGKNAKSLIRQEYAWVNKIREIESYYYNLSRRKNGNRF